MDLRAFHLLSVPVYSCLLLSYWYLWVPASEWARPDVTLLQFCY